MKILIKTIMVIAMMSVAVEGYAQPRYHRGYRSHYHGYYSPYYYTRPRVVYYGEFVRPSYYSTERTAEENANYLKIDGVSIEKGTGSVYIKARKVQLNIPTSKPNRIEVPTKKGNVIVITTGDGDVHVNVYHGEELASEYTL